jgi:predicted nuclease with TOPRIM domain
MYKKNKTNRRRNKKTLTKKNKRYKYKKGGNTNSRDKPLENEFFPDNLKILQNERILNRIKDTIQKCRDVIQNLNIEKDILFQEKVELSETYLSNLNEEIFNKIHELYKKINKIQNEQIDLYNYHTQFSKIYDILSNTGEELTPDGRERYIDEYNMLAMKFRQQYII